MLPDSISRASPPRPSIRSRTFNPPVPTSTRSTNSAANLLVTDTGALSLRLPEQGKDEFARPVENPDERRGDGSSPGLPLSLSLAGEFGDTVRKG